jgi:hypothetical protein
MKKQTDFNIMRLPILLVIIFYAGISFSQTVTHRYMIVRTMPLYTLQVNFNYNQSVLELAGTYNDDVHSEQIYEGSTFGADKGFGGNIVSKINLDRRGQIRFTQTIAFNRILSYTFGNKATLADVGHANYNAYTGGLGLEYNFTPSHRFKIYLGAEINASLINGETVIWFERKGNPLGDSSASYNIKNSFRIGFGVDFGSEFLLNSNIGIHVGVKFLDLNAFLRKSEGTNDDAEFKLRDADSSGLRFAGNKTFAFYSIIAGASFYFGIGEKRYKLK